MSESLRDTIIAAVEEHNPEPVDPGQVVEGTIPAAPTDTPEQKPGRTAGRARDEAGKLLPGKPVKEQQKEGGEAASTVVATPKPRPQRPSSWKKEYWDQWEKLDPTLAEYINQREGEYAKGVSTYKQEWDSVKPIAEAMAQFQPILQQHNIKPEVWISNLGNAHKMLATGTPEAKASMFLKLAKDYQIPIESLFVQGQDGRLYANPNIQPHQPQQQQAPQPDVRDLVRQTLLEEKVGQELQDFVAATDDKGQLKYPHFEAVKPTMLGLLQANLATDHIDAYKQALALPRHADLAALDLQQAQRAQLEAKTAEQAKVVARARNQTVSVKGSTPSAPADNKPKGRRESIEAAFDQHVDGGRI